MIVDLIFKHLKVLRVGENLSQEELGIKVGLTRQTINAIERKKKKPSKVQAIAIYHIFHDTDYCKQIIGDIPIE